MPVSFDALSEDPIPLGGCGLWNRRAVMVRTKTSAKDRRTEWVWSCEEQNFERDSEALA